ncbi:flavodoxin [Pseudoramibacter sp. HA2172]|uniref:flavodoxin n=1 Tax=Pseudoramibacter faecis TaxID=3108534 RepID=UPI002E75E3D9|nr:flavodoxin [Pseudoramibacter sp. HA2172]
MKKILVSYFSATGTTEKTARTLAKAIGADIEPIEAAVPYTAADLKWTDPNSRSSIEMKADKAERPALKAAADVAAYNVIFLGFPIWWYTAPTLVNAYLESGNFAGKTVVPFATSGGSGMGRVLDDLKPSAPDADWRAGRRFEVGTGEAALADWAKAVLG